MKKINLNPNVETADSFIKELKEMPSLEGIDINYNNANMYYKMVCEKKNCKNCKSLDHCKNTSLGYFTEVVTQYGVQTMKSVPCKYKKVSMKKEEDQSLFKTMYMPKSILMADFNQFKVSNPLRQEALNQSVKFTMNLKMKETTSGVLLYGPFGTGKTYLLGCIANELSKNKIGSILIYFPDLVRELKSSIGTPHLDELLNTLKTIDVLMLDDLGSESLTNWLRDEIIGPILNYRYQENLPICISTNLSPEDLFKHFAQTTEEAKYRQQDPIKGGRIFERIKALSNTMICMEEKFNG